MSQKTPRYQLTYPEATDHTRTWEHWQTLAQNVELALGAYTSWTFVALGCGTSVPANTEYGVGPVAVQQGTSVFTGATDGVVSKAPGLLVLAALYYIPANVSRNAWMNPPGASKLWYLDMFAGGGDRGSLAGVSYFTAAGQQLTFGQRSAAAVNTTFTGQGIFFPLPPA